MAEPEYEIISAADDESLLAALAQIFPSMFGMELTPVDDNALAAQTELGTLIVGVMSDFIVGLELRLDGLYRATPELLEMLNEHNASSAFITFSVLDERLWLTGNVDGRPLVPAHLARVLSYLAQAAAMVSGEVTPEPE